MFVDVTEATQKWAHIPGFPGYEVSDQGQVRNKNGRLLSQCLAARKAGFYVKLGKTTRLVHVLVMLAFRGPHPSRIAHLNGNKLDNRLSNLCYGEPGHKYLGRCSKGHDLVGDNVEFWGRRNHICVACREGKPAVRELPEWI
jgi:hypothetical protein